MNRFENIKTYADFAYMLGNLILANAFGKRQLELINGNLDENIEIFQYYIISNPDFALKYTDELIFYDDELDLYILGVTHFGTIWSGVSAPDFI